VADRSGARDRRAALYPAVIEHVLATVLTSRAKVKARITIAFVPTLLLVAGSLHAQQPPPQPYPPQPPQPYPPQPYPQPQYPYPQPYPQPQYPYPQPYPQPQYPYPQAQPYPQPAFPPPAQPPSAQAEVLVVEPIYPLIVGGVISFTLAYSVPLIAAGAQGFSNGSEWLAIPLFGPFVTIGERDWGCRGNADDCNDDLVGAGLAMSAIFQAAGVAMFIPGVLVKRERIEKVYAIAPIMTDEVLGLGMTGQF
jgi:hypothetical protein